MVMGAERAAEVNSRGAAVRAEAIPARSSVNVRIRTAWMLTSWPAWFGAGLPATSCQSRAVEGAAPDGLAPAGGATTPTNAASVRAATNTVAHLLFRLDLLIPSPLQRLIGSSSGFGPRVGGFACRVVRQLDGRVTGIPNAMSGALSHEGP